MPSDASPRAPEVPARLARLAATSALRGAGLARWQGASISLFGAGHLGGLLGPALARSGLGALTIVDFALGREENLGTQAVRPGEPKARTLAAACAAVAVPGASSGASAGPYEGTRVRALELDARRVSVRELARQTLWIDATDDAGLALPLTRLSNGLGVPLVRVAVDGSGERELGRVLVSHGGAGHACQVCPHEPARVASRRSPCPNGLPARAAPTIAGNGLGLAVAGLGLLQAQRVVTENDAERALGREVLVDLDGLALVPLELSRSDACLAGHGSFELVEPRGVAAATLGGLFETARAALGSDAVLAPHAHELRLAACDCGRLGARFAPPGAPVEVEGELEGAAGGLPCVCGARAAWSAVPPRAGLAEAEARALELLERSPAELGLFPGALVRAASGASAVHLLLPDR